MATEVLPDTSRPSTARPGDAEVPVALKALGTVIAPTSLLTALLFYFGWARIDAQAHYMGLDGSVLGYSTRDYILRSISGIYLPLAAVLLIGLLFLWGHLLVSQWATRGYVRAVRRLAVALAATGIAAFWLGVFEQFVQPPAGDPIIVPLCLAFTVVLVSYSFHLVRQLSQYRQVDRDPASRRWLATVNVAIVVLLLALSMFWAVADYAGAVGRGLAIDLMTHPESRPGVIVYSAKRLHITAPSTTETALDEPDSAFHFSYHGLRLLERTGGKFFLVPDAWLASRVTIVLPDNDSIRLEFTF